ncbi:hypothetical protein [Streptomyces sp. Mg1]|uniref:hypothetical protein n=1 Tax=Streptomyces sp. Mg1 TaxID=465541 RepID=UPI00017E893C|nr:hypothetical protein [Streptomyces sp. Mg1]EDX24831.1 hypothetical protein SSAG_04473 [Streptomyces sp. Mg1]
MSIPPPPSQPPAGGFGAPQDPPPGGFGAQVPPVPPAPPAPPQQPPAQPAAPQPPAAQPPADPRLPAYGNPQAGAGYVTRGAPGQFSPPGALGAPHHALYFFFIFCI